VAAEVGGRFALDDDEHPFLNVLGFGREDHQIGARFPASYSDCELHLDVRLRVKTSSDEAGAPRISSTVDPAWDSPAWYVRFDKRDAHYPA
jgi:hypothetical protein